MSSKVARRPYWNAMFCLETRGEIVERMQEVLADHYFTMVICNSYSETDRNFSAVEVYPSQWLEKPLSVAADESAIWWSTPKLSMGVRTGATTQADARNSGKLNYVHFTFEPDRVVIEHYAPAGYSLRWIFAVERHDREDGA